MNKTLRTYDTGIMEVRGFLPQNITSYLFTYLITNAFRQAKATELISPQINVMITSHQDVPFCQSQQIQYNACTMVLLPLSSFVSHSLKWLKLRRYCFYV